MNSKIASSPFAATTSDVHEVIALLSLIGPPPDQSPERQASGAAELSLTQGLGQTRYGLPVAKSAVLRAMYC